MNAWFRIRTLVLLFGMLLVIPQVTNAQITGGLFENPLAVQADPAFPEPGETVTVELIDYGSLNYGSAITWRYNGEVIANASNQRSVEVVAGPLGTQANVEAVLTNSNGTQEIARTIIKPLYIDIVLEPQTYTPPFYQGRAVPSIKSIVNATALITDGSAIGGSSYLYRWQVDQTILENGPLRGGDQVSFEMTLGKRAILILEVSDLTGRLVAQKAIEIPTVEPRVRFYEVSSLYGMSKRALGDQAVPLVGNSTTLRAIPYFLDSRTYNSPDINEWSINGRPVSNNATNPYTITLQGAVSGTKSNVEFHVRSLSQVLQGARDTVTVSY